MTGTLINCIGIVLGSLIGLIIKKGISSNIQAAVIKIQGIVVMIIGLNGVLCAMITVGTDGKLSSDGAVLLLISFVIGTIIGEILKLEDRINGIGDILDSKFGLGKATKGFVDCSLLFCIGSMSILGAINDGLTGDSSILLVKSALDCISSIFFASSLGIGVLFSAIPVLIYQGTISLAASILSPILTPEILNSFSMVGYALLICIGFNFTLNAKIKTTNLIPALFIPIIYNFIF